MARSCEHLLFWVVFVCCVLAGPVNAVFFKILYISFGERYSFFVCQMINVVYVVEGAVALHMVRDEITDEMRAIPHSKYVMMGLLDFVGGFMCSLGAFRTSGSKQQLFNQALIPCTMLCTYLFLGKRSSLMQVAGAIVVLLGAAVVIFPSVQGGVAHAHLHIHSHGPSDESAGAEQGAVLVAELLYLLSNVPMALSYVYKEFAFKNLAVHVMYLTQMVSIYQMLFGFLLVPLQAVVPGAPSVSDTVCDLYGGLQCFLQMDMGGRHGAGEDGVSCLGAENFWLLLGYCTVNFVFNTLGLYVVKYGSATLNSISYAIILPLTVLAFTLPGLGPFREACSSSTKYGLVVTLLGFSIWRWAPTVGDGEKNCADEEGLGSEDGAAGGQVQMAYIEAPAPVGLAGAGAGAGVHMEGLERGEGSAAVASEHSALLPGRATRESPEWGALPLQPRQTHYNGSPPKYSGPRGAQADFVPDSFHERVICGFT